PTEDADAVRVWSEAATLTGAEAQAAGLCLGRLRLSLPGDNQAAQALADWSAAMAKVHSPEDFRNPHVTREQLAEWFKEAMKLFQEPQDAPKAQALAELQRKLAPGGAAEFGLGEAAEALANQLRERAKLPGGSVTAADVQAQFRRAGAAYEQAAKSRP